MYQNYNYQQPTNLRQPGMGPVSSPSVMLKGRPVSSLEEARAATIDFDGSIFYFPDYANRCIYTKQINMDGTSSFMMYELKEIPVEKPKEYITREEFDTAIQQLTSQLAKPAPKPAAAEPPVKLNF